MAPFACGTQGMMGQRGGSSKAVQREGRGWDRLGLAIDAGFAGDSDGYGVQSPCAVRTRGGYLMCYAGFDGEVTRLHMATSPDGRDWAPQGTFVQWEGSEDGLGASHPCLVVTGERGGCSSPAMTARGTGDGPWSSLPSLPQAPLGTASGPSSNQHGASWQRLIHAWWRSPGPSTCSTGATTGSRSASPWRRRPTASRGSVEGRPLRRLGRVPMR